LRAHRGGGFIKDHIYLQGRRRIREYLEDGGSLKPLYVGKVPLESVERAEELIGSELNPPEYTPLVLHESIERVW